MEFMTPSGKSAAGFVHVTGIAIAYCPPLGERHGAIRDADHQPGFDGSCFLGGMRKRGLGRWDAGATDPGPTGRRKAGGWVDRGAIIIQPAEPAAAIEWLAVNGWRVSCGAVRPCKQTATARVN